MARQDTRVDGGQINFQRADGSNIDWIDFVSSNYCFRMVYENGLTGVVSFPRPGSNNEVNVAYLNGVSQTTNGYIRIHNGITIQWGTSVSNTTVTFPISFSSCFGVVATSNDGSNHYEEAFNCYGINGSNFYLQHRYGGYWAKWIAIGV